MSNEAVEYVRGIPVVKTFGQTIFSFKKFKDSIDRYNDDIEKRSSKKPEVTPSCVSNSPPAISVAKTPLIAAV